MEKDHQKHPSFRSDDRAAEQNITPYDNHGAPSLVAMDNPDDSKLGADDQARLAPKRGSRR